MHSKMIPLNTPCTVIVSGPSGVGKSTICEKLLCTKEAFSQPIAEICWVYAAHTYDSERFGRLKKNAIAPIKFIEDYPAEDIATNKLFTSPNDAQKILVIDDILTYPRAIKSIFDLFSIYSHHQSITVIVSIHNLSGSTALQRSCLNNLLRNTGYLVLFPSRRMLPVIRSLANNYFTGETHRLIQPFNEILSSPGHRYLVVDFLTENSELVVREGGLTTNDVCYGFKFEDEEVHTKRKRQHERA